jgi:putative transposase
MARIVVPNYPHHVLHRGINGFPVFARADYCRAYLENLAQCKDELGARVYAYCLMPDHLRLIVDPGSDPATLGQLMKCLAGRHSQLLNGLSARRGRVWEGRFRSTPIQSERYLLACMRYVEASPVRAKMVDAPERYPWSSLRERRPGETARVLDLDEHYLACAEHPEARYVRYARWVAAPASDTENHFLGWSVRSGTPCGSSEFIRTIEEKYGVRFPRKMYTRCHPTRSGILL